MNSKKLFGALIAAALFVASCQKDIDSTPLNQPESFVAEKPDSFKQLASIDLGGETASEISAYDPSNKKLFVVSNDGGVKVEIVDLTNYPTLSKTRTLTFPNNAGINSVAVSNGLLAVALDGVNKQANGDVLVYKTSDMSEVKKISVGAMPDMVTFTPDGNYILTANEGEPSDDYTIDPVGSISVIDVKNNYTAKTFDFASFESQKATLVAGGFRIYGGPDGKKSSFAQDIEPEYITVANDSKKAWVTLQENNGVAEIDILAGKINNIMPLGLRDLSVAGNEVDFTVTADGKPEFKNWPVKAFYLPDAVSYFTANENQYLALANEGDTRDWAAYKEEVEVGKMTLSATKFATYPNLKADLNKLIVSKDFGYNPTDKVYDELYAFGTRSFSIINAVTGQLVANVGKELAQKAADAKLYDIKRAVKKGIEVEGITVGKVNGKTLVFVGMERADAVAVYDVSIPSTPKFLQLLEAGDAPEGLLFVKPADSPNGRSLLIVTSEGDGTVKFYQPDKA